jgi:hypothetical protein
MSNGEDLAYQTLDYIREHPKEWDQGLYWCGTSACFAGRAIILDAENHREDSQYIRGRCSDPGPYAAALLGWNWDDAKTVFGNMTHDFSELERLVKNVLNGTVDEADRI